MKVSFGSVSARLSWEVSLGDTGKILTLRSRTIINNLTNIAIQVSIFHRDRSQTPIGTVAPLSSLAVPANISRVESIMVRPSLGL